MTFTIAEPVVKFSSSSLELASRLHRPLARLSILLSCMGLLATGMGVQASHGPNYASEAAMTSPSVLRSRSPRRFFRHRAAIFLVKPRKPISWVRVIW